MVTLSKSGTPRKAGQRVGKVSKTGSSAQLALVFPDIGKTSVSGLAPVSLSPSQVVDTCGSSSIPPVKVIGQSNLDLTGRRIVKRGDLVSWHGLRFKVSRVRMGSLYPYVPPGEWRGGLPAFLPCRSVQVVA